MLFPAPGAFPPALGGVLALEAPDLTALELRYTSHDPHAAFDEPALRAVTLDGMQPLLSVGDEATARALRTVVLEAVHRAR